jgi:hypothetical protein
MFCAVKVPTGQPAPESVVFTTTGPLKGNVGLPDGVPADTKIVLSSITAGLLASTPASVTEVTLTLQEVKPARTMVLK